MNLSELPMQSNEGGPLTKKLKKTNEILSNALRESRDELEEHKKRQEQVAEQVKRSLQVKYSFTK